MLFHNKTLWFFLWTHKNQQTVKKVVQNKYV